ncbi:MAG: hypothetical protein C4541_03770 [Candidatus Auribacter fodinae]|uniref:DUF3566 domain-containing protein n=1 Tax=Candidatus Auribacter fodinae TaxID=2093366 RepID=A0A3A4R6I8_9BACT|nr:MAG: hypothetical protein C4541_03770 [Candidatus Auribacter fodinae]
MRHKNSQEMLLVSIDPVGIFTLFSSISIIVSIVVLLVMHNMHKISLVGYVNHLPFKIEGIFAPLVNPFTIALIMGLGIGLLCGVVIMFITLLFNLFVSVMGGIKIYVRE